MMKYVHLKNPIHENIKYSDFPKTQPRSVFRASGVMETQVKLLAHKTWHFVILEYFMKDKAIK